MPRTDFTYEEFEGLLASFYLTLLPMRSSHRREDQEDFRTATDILNGFAQRHGVQSVQITKDRPRPTKASWGQPAVIETCWSVMDMMGSFWRDFGVGAEPTTVDGLERAKLGRLLLGTMHRHGAISAKFDELEGRQVAVGIKHRMAGYDRPFAELFKR